MNQYNDLALTSHVINLAEGFVKMIVGWHYVPALGVVEMTTEKTNIDSFTRALLGLGWITPYNPTNSSHSLDEGYYVNDSSVPLNRLVTAHKYNPLKTQEAILFVAEFGNVLGYSNTAEWYREGYSAVFLQRCVNEGLDPNLITPLHFDE